MQFLRDQGNLQAYKLEGIEWKELRFENGESYRGGWREDKPEGEGIYTWEDGSVYEGSWAEGLKHGWGKYTWPNGAQYQGEWQRGFLQGYGTFRSPDGSVYQGGWASNIKHGIGKKTYANGDFYEGLWRHGKAEGPGRYVWAQGNVYDGEWRAGKMHGQGTLRWRSGERYDGEWREGGEDGIGVFTWQDGSTYEGFWVQGKKEGVGVFRPANANKATLLPPNEPSSVQPTSSFDEGELGDGEEAVFDRPIDSPTVARGPQARDARVAVAEGGGRNTVYVCEYLAGRLAHEEALSSEDLEVIFGPMQQHLHRKRRLRRRGKGRRQELMGETIFKGHRSYDLMLNLQLGIRYTLTTLSKVPRPKQITDMHFQEKVWLRFPRNGSEVTPPHPSNDFKWKDYCPEAFRRLRDVFGINTSEYLLSICGDQALRELPSPGKSGSVFFISHDDQYMIKTMRKEEIKLLLASLPRYLAHVSAHPSTLLLRFFGVHRVKPSHGLKVRFVVMNNVFRTEVPLHRKYDLKGSTLGRTVGAKMSATAIRKDLDLDVSFKIDPSHRQRLMDQLSADCAFLEELRVMDYSLLLGVHFRSYGDTSASPMNTDKEDDGAFETADDGGDDSEALRVPAGANGGSPAHRRSVSHSGTLHLPPADDDADMQVVESMHDLHLDRHSGVVAEPEPSSISFLNFWGRKQHSQQRERPSQRELAAGRMEPPQSGDGVPPMPRAERPPDSGSFSRGAPSRLRSSALAAAAREAPAVDSPLAVAVQGGAAAQHRRSQERRLSEERRLSQERRLSRHLASTSADSSSNGLERGPARLRPAGASVGGSGASTPSLAASTPTAAAPAAEAGGLPRPPRPGSTHHTEQGQVQQQSQPQPQQQPPHQQQEQQQQQSSQQASLENAEGAQAAAAGGSTPGSPPQEAAADSSTPGASPHAAHPPPKLIRWRSDAVQLPELLRGGSGGYPISSSSSSLRRSSQHQAPPSGRSSLTHQLPHPAAGPSVIAQLPTIPRSPSDSVDAEVAAGAGAAVTPPSPSPFAAGSAEAAGDAAFAAAATAAAAPGSATPQSSLLPQPADAGRGVGSPPRRHTMPPQLHGANNSMSAPGTAREGLGPQGDAWSEGGPGSLASVEIARAISAPAASFGAYASAGVKLRGGVGGLVNCGPPVIDAPSSFRRMATTGARVSGGVLKRPDSNLDLTSPEAAPLVARIRNKLERPVSDRLLKDLLKLARYRMLGRNGGARSFRAPTMVLAARSRRNSAGMLGRLTSEDEREGQAAPEQPGLNLPGVALSRQAGQPAEDVVLFCGIIDFLQEYNLRKMLEHNLKAVVQDGRAISVVEPRHYSRRFLGFLSGVFVS